MKNTSPVTNVEAGTTKIVGLYDLNGKRQAKWQRGVNIVRMKDGSTRKVLVK